mgnify:CR=1 FL=1
MTLDDIPDILKRLPDSDCLPNIVFYPRQFQAPRSSAEVMGNLLYQPANAAQINQILEARIERATKPNRQRILKAIPTSDSIDWLPSESLEIGQPFSCEQAKGTMFVMAKTLDPRGGCWIVTNHPDLRSFHTRNITKVLAVKKAPQPDYPALVSIGKPINALTEEDFKQNNLPTDDEAAAAFRSGQISAQQYRVIGDAAAYHRDPALYLDMVQLAGA